MNLKHMETFHHFCRFLNVSRTADHLYITQPAVSQQLRSFQAECGVQLFYREGNEFKLTEAGEDLYLLSRRIFRRVDQMEELLSRTRADTSETLRIGMTKAYASIVMPELIAVFQQKYPRIHVRLSEGNSADLLARLRNRKEDLVVVARSDYGSSLRSIPFAKAEFMLLARADHPLAQQGPVSITALNGEPMIIREHGSGSRNEILGTLRRFNVNPSVLVESESLSFILAYIERRMAVSFILSHEIKNELFRGVFKQINLVEGNIAFHSDIVLRQNESPSLPLAYFLGILKKHGETRLSS